jgi:hypothetical protein
MIHSVAQQSSNSASPYYEPDSLISHQYFKVFRQKSHFEPEEKLMFAVLADAIECFQKYLGVNASRRRKLFLQAEAWIYSGDSSWPYSFENICEVLNINPRYLRLGLIQWRLNHESQENPRKSRRKTLRYQNTVKSTRLCLSQRRVPAAAARSSRKSRYAERGKEDYFLCRAKEK